MPPRLTTQEFIERARAVHGDKYGYAFSVYQSAYEKSLIHCKKHGMFEQEPRHHLSGVGCPDCGVLTSIKSRTKKQSHFISQAVVVHGDKYDYSKVEYVNTNSNVKIVCPEHGVFEQRPSHHLNGVRCPGCMSCGFDRTKVGFLYVLRSECGRYMKIGITNKPVQRHAQLSRATPFSFKRIELIEGPGDRIANLEKELLAKYEPAGFTETFDGSTEWRLWSDSIRHKLISFMNKGDLNGPL